VFKPLPTLTLLMALAPALLAQPEQAHLHASLAAAQELYASADYQGALDMLDRLGAAGPAVQARQSIDLYRTFCFIALGRTGEADDAITAMITRDPLYRPADSDVPPRLRPLFSDKRRLLLPTVIQSKYALAKGAFERGEYKTAADGFTEVLIAFSDPEIEGQVSRPPLSDLRVLAIGFNDLAVRAMTPRAAPRPEVTVPPLPPSDTPRVETLGVDMPRTPAIYDVNDADVVAPVTVRQEMPRFHRPVTADRIGVLFVIIDETGRVESAISTTALDSYYDSMLLQAAKTWRYQPAMRNGVAVKYRKSIRLTLSRQAK
jgi:hypothetical protein